MQDIVKEDLKIKNPLDMLTMGMKVMAFKDGSESEEMKEMATKVMRRIEKLYKKKMKPVLR